MRVVGLWVGHLIYVSVFFCKKSRLNLMIYKQKLMLVEHLLCAGPCARRWRWSGERDIALPSRGWLSYGTLTGRWAGVEDAERAPWEGLFLIFVSIRYSWQSRGNSQVTERYFPAHLQWEVMPTQASGDLCGPSDHSRDCFKCLSPTLVGRSMDCGTDYLSLKFGSTTY